MTAARTPQGSDIFTISFFPQGDAAQLLFRSRGAQTSPVKL